MTNRTAEEVAAGLKALSERVAALPHMDRGKLNEEIASVLPGEQFNHCYLGHIDAANRLAIPGYSWCAGVSIDDDGIVQPWANVHSSHAYNTGRRVDVSINAASESIALAAAWLSVRAILKGENYDD